MTAAPTGPTSTTAPTELVRVVRSGFHECSHYGALVVLGPDGGTVLALGDVTSPIFPRSSNKPFQATAMLAVGADLADADLALSAASHSGEPMHTERALQILARHGLGEDALGCPPDLPLDEPTRDEVIRSVAPGEPQARRIYMNCSGKHSGMLAACVAAGFDTAGYLDPQHPYQQQVTDEITRLTGETPAAIAVDGCGAPLAAISLTALARGFARAVTAEVGTAERTVADAMRAYPELVAGTGRDDTLVMQSAPGVLMKGGAEGVHVAALADGSAAAIKITDGAARARMPVMIPALQALGVDFSGTAAAPLAVGQVLGGGRPVGTVEASPAVTAALSTLT